MSLEARRISITCHFCSRMSTSFCVAFATRVVFPMGLSLVLSHCLANNTILLWIESSVTYVVDCSLNKRSADRPCATLTVRRYSVLKSFVHWQSCLALPSHWVFICGTSILILKLQCTMWPRIVCVQRVCQLWVSIWVGKLHYDVTKTASRRLFFVVIGNLTLPSFVMSSFLSRMRSFLRLW